MTAIPSRVNAFSAAKSTLRFGKHANPALRFGLADTDPSSESDTVSNTSAPNAPASGSAGKSDAKTAKIPEPTARQKNIVRFFGFIVPALSGAAWMTRNPVYMLLSGLVAWGSGSISRHLKNRFDKKAFSEMDATMQEIHNLSKEEAKGNDNDISKFLGIGNDIFIAALGTMQKSISPYLEMLARKKESSKLLKGVFARFHSALSKAQHVDLEALKNAKYLKMLGPIAFGVHINLSIAQQDNPAKALWTGIREGAESFFFYKAGSLFANNRIAGLFGFGKK